MTIAHTKKVTFAKSPRVALEDKENNVPTKQPTEAETTSQRIDEENDFLLSTSVGALSVKPVRVTKTKLHQPSTGAFAEKIPELPALSPMKVRRPKRVFTAVDKDMEDDLLCPTSPRLAEKPKRPMQSLGSKSVIDGAELLLPKTTSTLFGSPARRLLPSPAKQKTSSSTTVDAHISSSKLGLLSSPARRPVRTGTKLGGSSLKYSLDLSSDPFVLPKVADDSGDVFRSKPILGRKVPVKEDQETFKEIPKETPKDGLTRNKAFIDLLNSLKKEKAAKREAVAKDKEIALSPEDVKASDMASDGPLVVVFSGSTTPTTPPSMVDRSNSSATPSHGPKGVCPAKMDESGDIAMTEEHSNSTAGAEVLRSKHYRSPSDGGSSFGLSETNGEDEDDLDCDSENVPPPQAAAILSGVARNSGRGFGHELNLSVMNPSKTLHYGTGSEIPVDPMLLGEDISDVAIGCPEVRRPPVTVPVKFHDDGADVIGSGNNAAPIDHMHEERSGGVLAGAVVFVDAYTNEGYNCGETFEKMLKGMGAKVLKKWSWNPDSATPGKVGITHVVFKDGSPRTLQKVKAARGLVSCVALRWIIECAQRDEWLDEVLYAIDLDDVPRGGRRVSSPIPSNQMESVLTVYQRPKSMEALPLPHLTAGPNDSSKKTPPKNPAHEQDQSQPPKTAPPLWDLGPSFHSSPIILERIKLAKRKSMQFAPKIGSPLVKSWQAE